MNSFQNSKKLDGWLAWGTAADRSDPPQAAKTSGGGKARRDPSGRSSQTGSMKRQFLARLILIAVPTLFLTPAQVIAQSSAATLALSPASGTVTLESNFNVGLFLDTRGASVDGMDAKILYEPGKLQIKQITINPDAFYDYPTKTANSTTGRITIQGTARAGSPYSNNGPVQVATLNLQALATGTSSLKFDFLRGATTDSNVAESGTNEDILVAATNATFTIAATTSASPLPSPGSDLPVGATIAPTILLVGAAIILLGLGFWHLRQNNLS